MTAVFPTILAVLLGLTFQEYHADAAPSDGSGWTLLLALPLCLLPVIVAESVLWLAARRFDAGRPFDHRRYADWVALLPLPAYAAILFVLRWPQVLDWAGLEHTFLLDHVVVIGPYLVLYVLATVESLRLRRPFWIAERGARPARVAEVRDRAVESLRQLLLVLVPVFLLLLPLDLVRDTGLRLYFQNLPLLSTAFLLLLFLTLAFAFPVLVRYALRLKPLYPSSPLRVHLEAQARQLGFRCRDMMMWSTRRPVLNAAIVGVVPWFRYVILTTELCKQLTLPELGAVFAHEAGHGKRHHALYYTLFSLAFFTLLAPLSNAVGRFVEAWTAGALGAAEAGAALVFLPAFAVYWLVLFGYLSRRFELEADVYGAEASHDPRLFIETLEKVARLARIRKGARAMWHFSIAGRSEFLRRAFLDGESGALHAFRERLRLLRRGILVGSALVLAVAAGFLALESLRGLGAVLLELRRPAQAREVLTAVLRFDDEDPVALTLLAELDLLAGGAHTDGGVHWRRVEAMGPWLLQQERAEVLDALRLGWGRTTVASRHELAVLLTERAQRINRVQRQDHEQVFDAEVEEELLEMARVSAALAEGDGAVVQALLAADPPWLRRLDTRGLRAWLDAAAQARRDA